MIPHVDVPMWIQVLFCLMLIGALLAGFGLGKMDERLKWHQLVREAAKNPKVQNPKLIAEVERAGVTVIDKEQN